MTSRRTVLFLHGLEGKPGGTKARVLAARGCRVVSPALPADDFAQSGALAQAAFDEHRPDVVVGSSRGGAVALSLRTGDAKVVLLCPAWRRFAPEAVAPPTTHILHARADDKVAYADSEALLARSGLPSTRLRAVGVDHRLHHQDAYAWLLRLVIDVPADVDPGHFTGRRWIYEDVESDRGGHYDATANALVPDLGDEAADLEGISLPPAQASAFESLSAPGMGEARYRPFFDPVLKRGLVVFGWFDADGEGSYDGEKTFEHVEDWDDLLARAEAAASTLLPAIEAD
jgi:hypothetical protein